MKFAVIHSTLNLKREIVISPMTRAADNAPDKAGRRSTKSQKQFSRPQLRTKASLGTTSTSLHNSSTSAASWNIMLGASRQKPCWDNTAESGIRLASEDRIGGMVATFERLSRRLY
jgi:hypothetical protein